jgi:hypothetical protein
VALAVKPVVEEIDAEETGGEHGPGLLGKVEEAGVRVEPEVGGEQGGLHEHPEELLDHAAAEVGEGVGEAVNPALENPRGQNLDPDEDEEEGYGGDDELHLEKVEMLSLLFAASIKDCNHAALRISLRKMWPFRDSSKVLGWSAFRLPDLRVHRRTTYLGAGVPVQGHRVVRNRLRQVRFRQRGLERDRSQGNGFFVVGTSQRFRTQRLRTQGQ